jgi:hypothetical protein
MGFPYYTLLTTIVSLYAFSLYRAPRSLELYTASYIIQYTLLWHALVPHLLRDKIITKLLSMPLEKPANQILESPVLIFHWVSSPLRCIINRIAPSFQLWGFHVSARLPTLVSVEGCSAPTTLFLVSIACTSSS